MRSLTPTDLDWSVLLRVIEKEKCVPVLGAAVNASSPARGYVGLPLGGELGRELARRIAPETELAQADAIGAGLSLAEITMMFSVFTDRAHLVETLRELLDDAPCEPSPLLRTLARLPLSLIVTTNYDRLLERALEEAGREFLVAVQPTRGIHNGRLFEFRDQVGEERDHPLIVYKLHGSFGPDNEGGTDDILIDEDDYIEFMTILSRNDVPPLPVKWRLASGVPLFLGYSLRDWDFRMLWKNLNRLHREAFAVLRGSPDWWLFYLDRIGIKVFDADIHEFADELDSRWHDAMQRQGDDAIG